MRLYGFARQLAAAVTGLGLLTGAAGAASAAWEQANDDVRSPTIGADRSPPPITRATYEQGRELRGNPIEEEDRYEEDRYRGRGKSSYCHDYARQAYRAAEINEQRDCGFTGSRWHLRQSSHYQWCLRVPRQRAESEIEARRDLLRRCRGGESGGSFCNDYARRAVRAQRTNQRLDCGYTGYLWSSNFNTHYNWCRDASHRSVVRALREREDQLSRCRYPH